MSGNQARVEKKEYQYRKTTGGGQSNLSAGVGGGFQHHSPHHFPATGRGVSSAPPSSTRSYNKKSNNVQVGQSRGNLGGVTIPSDPNSGSAAAARSVENGGHVQSAIHGVSHSPVPASIPKSADMSAQKDSRSVPKATSSQSSSMTSDSTLPSTPSKGDADKGFPLQFGSISPGLMNGSQVPPRTTSAPPNLDEQKRLQAWRDARHVPAVPVQPAPKQQVPKKDVALTEKPITHETHSDLNVKRIVPVTPAPSSPPAPKPSGVPMAGMSIPMPYHQPTIPMQFGGPNPQVQSQGMPNTALQMPLQMPLPMGNPSHVQQQGFMPSLQHPLMQTPGILHQGQSLGFNPQLGYQLPHQMGNIGMNLSPQFNQHNQQQAGKFGGARKTVKITHPETHEELRLDRRDGGSPGSKSQHVGPPQSQPVPTYAPAHPIGYYSNSYATSPPFFPSPNSLPLVSTPMSSGSQAPRFPYPVSHASPTMSFMNQPATNSLSNSKGGAPSKQIPLEPSPSDIVRDAAPSSPSSATVTVKAAGGFARERGADPKAVEKLDSQKQHSAVVPGSSGPKNVDVKTEALIKSDSIRDMQNYPGKDGDLQPRYQVCGESSKVEASKSASVKRTHTPFGIRNAESVAAQELPTIMNAASRDAAGVDFCTEQKEGFDDHANQNDLLRGATKESSAVKELGEKKALGGLQPDNSLKVVDVVKKTGQDGDAKFVQKAGVVETSQKETESATSLTKGDMIVLQTSLPECGSIPSNVATLSHSTTTLSQKDCLSCKESDAEENVGRDGEVIEDTRPNSSSGLVSGSNKTSVDPGKTKNNKGKKKRKEIPQKADAQGTTSDLYMAFKGPEQKKEAVVAMADASDSNMKDVTADDSDRPENSLRKKVDEKNKPELEDWEDAADVSVKVVSVHEDNDEEGGTSKKYSRDFLLTFAEQCIDLPEGFEVAFDVSDAFVGSNVNASRGSREHPSPGRIVDRPSGAARPERRGNGMMDAAWGKSPGSHPLGRDLGYDLAYGSNVVGFRPGPGAVLRNSRGQGPVQHAGGILSGPMHSFGFQGMHRNDLDQDRWQRATNFNKGLMSPPQTPVPAMHKAEIKYEVGKVTDEEQAKQRRLKAILNKLTPQNFEKLFEQVKEVNIDNAVTLTGVISQIFDKALMEPTFCEMYANFCLHLASELPDLSVDNEKITFKRLLLNKCQEEFERGEREEEEANKVDGEGETKQSDEEREEKRLKARRRMLGNIRLIGELYKKRMLTERIMHECIKKLLGHYQTPDEENIEALCKLMSTIGEMIDHPKAKEHMDAYYDIMGQLSNNMKLSSRVRFMLRDSIDLRKNKWQQRRKVEGPKKIEEVHRDAAQERQGQTGRLGRGPSMSSSMRRGQPLDYGPRASMLSSPAGQVPGFRGVPAQARGYGGQDVRIDDRSVFENRTLSVPLPQRTLGDESITLGPQGGLAKGMSFRGQPLVTSAHPVDSFSSNGDPRRMVGGVNGYSTASDRGPYISREVQFARHTPESFGTPSAHDQSRTQQLSHNHMNMASENPDRSVNRSMLISPPTSQVGSAPAQNLSSEKVWPEERLRDMSIAAIKEYYSANDVKEVALCIKDLNTPSFYPTVISIWVTDAFERKDLERDMLSELLVSLAKPEEGIFTHDQLIEGFESVLTNLEDTVTDAPRAPEFLGRIFGKVVLENILPLKEVGHLIHEGREEPGRLVEAGLAADVLGSILEMIKSEKGESVLNEIRTSSSLRLEDFRPPDRIKSKKLEMFIL